MEWNDMQLSPIDSPAILVEEFLAGVLQVEIRAQVGWKEWFSGQGIRLMSTQML